jgi:DNA-binding transcriptional MerR regulator
LAPTVRATKKPPAMAPKRASSKAAPSVDEVAKVALLAEKKGKALADTTHQEACEDDTLSKRQHNDQPTPKGTLRTCSSGGQPQPPPGFAPLEGEDATEDGEVIGVSAEEQLQLRALRIKNHNLQKQKEILEAKRQHVSAQTKVRQMIHDEEQRAQELEQEIALMQREGQHDLQHGPPLQQRAPIEDLFIPSVDLSSRTPQHSKASTTLMSGVLWRHTCKCHHGPPTSGQGPTPSTTAASTQHSIS